MSRMRFALRTGRQAVAALIAMASASAFSAVDTKLLDAAKQAQPALVETLKTMVSIESGSGDSAGLAVLKELGWTDYATLTVLMNPDEEVGSGGSGQTIAALAADHDYVLSCEPTAAKAVAKTEALLLGAAGTATVTMEVKGRASHAGAAPELGRNAILEIAFQMLATSDLAKDIPGAIMNWTNVISNKATNQIPELAVAIADVRMTVPGVEQKLDAALQAKVASAKRVPDTQTTVKMVVGRPAFVAGA